MCLIFVSCSGASDTQRGQVRFRYVLPCVRAVVAACDPTVHVCSVACSSTSSVAVPELSEADPENHGHLQYPSAHTLPERVEHH